MKSNKELSLWRLNIVVRKGFTHLILVCFLLLLTLLPYDILASNFDSLLIKKLKAYFLKATGYKVDKNLFMVWSTSNKPSVVLYISSSAKVGAPPDLVGMINSFGRDEEYIKRYAMKYDTLGYHTFIYKTYGTMLAELSERFVSYSPESQCFIALHEFIHGYVKNHLAEIKDRKRPIPYNYEEALGDIVGNYGAIEFAKTSRGIDLRKARSQKSRTEKIYRVVNKTTKRIDSDSGKVAKLNLKCQERIEHVLARGDLFQMDRFSYTVNNAYLLKNRNYAENYFVLKKLLRRSGVVRNLIRIIDSSPTDPTIDHYIKNYCSKFSAN